MEPINQRGGMRSAPVASPLRCNDGLKNRQGTQLQRRSTMEPINQRGGMRRRAPRWALAALTLAAPCTGFVAPPSHAPSSTSPRTTELYHWANRLDKRFGEPDEIAADDDQATIFTRRSFLSLGVAGTAASALLSPLVANADFAPGGTLLDREVSIFYSNPEASPSRDATNKNVLFGQDNYFKFGAGAQWIEPGSTEFPKTMPFVLSQQRYDALKKYGSRVESAKEIIVKIGSAEAADVPENTDPIYQLRALGLLANSFLGSENTGVTNELMLARWYINEAYLRIGDYRSALEKGDAKEAKTSYACLLKAMNSLLTLLNRQITSKVGDPFGYL